MDAASPRLGASLGVVRDPMNLHRIEGRHMQPPARPSYGPSEAVAEAAVEGVPSVIAARAGVTSIRGRTPVLPNRYVQT